MPQIENNFRKRFDINIEKLVDDIARTVSDKDLEDFDSNDVLNCSSSINYAISKICGSFVAGKISCSKITVLVGVLDSVKQQFHQRMPGSEN